MNIEDIQPKIDNAEKIRYIEENNIPNEEVIRAEEFNALLQAELESKSDIKNLKENQDWSQFDFDESTAKPLEKYINQTQ